MASFSVYFLIVDHDLVFLLRSISLSLSFAGSSVRTLNVRSFSYGLALSLIYTLSLGDFIQLYGIFNTICGGTHVFLSGHNAL